MKLFHVYLRREQARCLENGVRVSVIGRRDRLPRLLLPVMEECEKATARGQRLHLRLAVDYSSRDAIARAAQKLKGQVTREKLSRRARRAGHRSADSHRRRAASERFSALGIRLRRAGLHTRDVAGLRGFGSGRGGGRVPLARAPFRRAAAEGGIGVTVHLQVRDSISRAQATHLPERRRVTTDLAKNTSRKPTSGINMPGSGTAAAAGV